MKEKFIKVWEFYDAPEEYQKLSTCGGDEDFIVFIPTGKDCPYQLEELGCCGNDKIAVKGGKIIISSHA